MSNEMPQWYYASPSREKMGPVQEPYLRQLLESGQLSLSTLVWMQGMSTWQPVSEVAALRRNSASNTEVTLPLSATVMDYAGGVGSAPRPWVRFWARLISMVVYSLILLLPCFVIMLLLIFVMGGNSPITKNVTNISVQIIMWGGWVFIEAYSLSKYGSTPGQGVFKTKVCNLDGSLLTYNQALKRTLRLFLAGLGLNIIGISIITQILGYFKLKENGQSYWDLQGGHITVTEGLTTTRMNVIIGAIVLFYVIAFIAIMLFAISSVLQRH